MERKQMQPKGIIVFEGADCAGKTTLAHEIGKRHKSDYFHMGKTDDPFQLCLDTFQYAIAASERGLALVDRSWISEIAYGLTYRNETRLKASARCLDRLLLKHAALNVMCVPHDVERQIVLHAKMKQERDEMYDNIADVALWYKRLMDNELKISGLKDFANRADVIRYDMFRCDPKNFGNTINVVLSQLESLRARQLSTALDPAVHNFQGHVVDVELVFVGDDLSPKTEWPWPWFWHHETNGSAQLLNNILHDLDLDESRAVYLNANQIPDMLNPLLENLRSRRKEIKFIALGGKAAKALKESTVEERHELILLRHPQFVKRFHFHDIETYRQEIKDAITY
jgi:hypothetical protein